MGNRSVYGGGSKEVKKEWGKSKVPSNLVVGFTSCGGACKRKLLGHGGWRSYSLGYWVGSSIDGGRRGG